MAELEPGDVVRIVVDREPWTVRVSFRFQFGAWMARSVSVEGGRVHDRSEPFVLEDSTTVVERLCDRAWYARHGEQRGGGSDADPLLGGA